jgi:NodT family efflux transporter outer membrane factor (OMF) lipoprotein
MLGPDYHTPELAIQEEWNADAAALTIEPLSSWWEVFEDPLLTKYIERAVEANYDVQAAEANVLRARALKQITASKLFPHVSGDLNGTKTYFSKNGPVFAIGQATGNPADTSSALTNLPFAVQVPQIQNLFNALFDASWELDLFGKNRRALESATAEWESAIEKKNDTLLSVLAEVARNYMELRSFQRRSRLIEENIALNEAQTEIVKRNVQFGYFNEIDLQTIEASLALAKAALPETTAEIYRSIYTLSILIGKPPETLIDELFLDKPMPKCPAQVAVGLRSELLKRRPDIREAERKLAAATANIGVAVASFFPATTLAGTGGFQSLVLPTLFEWGSRTWAYGADVNMPIFEGGRLVGYLHLSRADQAKAAAEYQQTILSALKDAENSLKKYEQSRLAAKDYDQNVLHNEAVVTITRERFLKGLINKIDLLNNEKQLITAELKQLDSQTTELMSLISLFKALGGGVEKGSSI